MSELRVINDAHKSAYNTFRRILNYIDIEIGLFLDKSLKVAYVRCTVT